MNKHPDQLIEYVYCVEKDMFEYFRKHLHMRSIAETYAAAICFKKTDDLDEEDTQSFSEKRLEQLELVIEMMKDFTDRDVLKNCAYICRKLLVTCSEVFDAKHIFEEFITHEKLLPLVF